MDPSGQVGERRRVALHDLRYELIHIVARGYVELPDELPVNGVLDYDIPDKAAVVDQDLKLLFHLLRPVPARDPVDDALRALRQHISSHGQTEAGNSPIDKEHEHQWCKKSIYDI